MCLEYRAIFTAMLQVLSKCGIWICHVCTFFMCCFCTCRFCNCPFTHLCEKNYVWNGCCSESCLKLIVEIFVSYYYCIKCNSLWIHCICMSWYLFLKLVNFVLNCMKPVVRMCQKVWVSIILGWRNYYSVYYDCADSFAHLALYVHLLLSISFLGPSLFLNVSWVCSLLSVIINSGFTRNHCILDRWESNSVTK